MSRIDYLIRHLCPIGVSFKPLGEIARLVRGNGMPKTDFTDDGVGAIHYGQIYTRYGVWATDTISFVAPATAAKLAKAEPGDIIITNTSENVEDVGKAVAWLGSEPIVTGGHATVIKHDQDSKYLSYWFQSESFRVQKKALATGTKVIDVSAKQLAKVRVPVPPLEVQREIVRVLDQFTQLEAELEAELVARHRQYEHYRHVLLSGDQAPSVLGEYVSFAGKAVTPSAMTETEVAIYSLPAFDRGLGPERMRPQDVGSAKNRISGPSVLVAKLNPHIPRVWSLPVVAGGAYASPEFYQLVPDMRLSLDYLAHLLRDNMSTLAGLVTGSTNSHKRLQREHIMNVPVRVPPLAEQKRVVVLLNQLDDLGADLSIGLPAELAARRTQYEYYRDRLMTFKEAA
ncbi:restriction endonuclease subunit S [Cryobacterium sp. BB736]|uniref:restriction endonuclease subunit S n=1 Tax=Cryobacterium sp. BB736 TaxID=2746963 RepID=UPI001874A168|nr:restriction endonuclease subunit S [Cryobacterium sp. BB736]